MIFATDALFASLFACALFLLFFTAAAPYAAAYADAFEQSRVQQFALFAADALTQNSDPQNPFLGAAVFDAQKNRVRSGVIDTALLAHIRGAPPHCRARLCVCVLSLIPTSGPATRFLSPSTGHAPVAAVQRLVVLSTGEKAVLEVGVCPR